jgi:glycosyltransferase involved in cell wall biosynthesis
MSDATPQVAAILTAYAEGVMAGLSFRSLLDAVAVARADGIDVEVLVVLDNPTDATRTAFSEAEEHGAAVAEVSYADQGKVRNHAVGLTRAGHIAFLDGDDLWSENWLVDAYRMCVEGEGGADQDRVIGHPELNWFFENQQNLYFLPDQTDPAFDPALLRIANPWDALCLAPRAAYVEHPFAERAVADGYAYEDWHWMLETYRDGYVHRVVPETIHFKRRREGSQYVQARARSVLTRPSELLDFAWWQERDRRV